MTGFVTCMTGIVTAGAARAVGLERGAKRPLAIALFVPKVIRHDGHKEVNVILLESVAHVMKGGEIIK